MTRIVWRWEEQDFGFRFREGKGGKSAEYYQARNATDFYIVSPGQRKLTPERIEALAPLLPRPASAQVVTNPWRNYERDDWDWIETDDGICLNFAGCLNKDEIARREDEGVQRAMEVVAESVTRSDTAPLSIRMVREIQKQLMGTIYPFAGEWRTVALHKGEGPTKWPLPSTGIQPLMDILDRDVFSRSPMISANDDEVFAFASEVMNELLAIHPFREGNGRTAFIVGNLVLMQNNLLPLTTYERHSDEARYYAACEAGRIHKDYAPLTALISEWEQMAFERWEKQHG